MRAGRLNQRIIIEKPKVKKKASGQVIADGWEPHCSLWAEVECTDSSTQSGDGVYQHEMLHRFYIRYRDDITATMRVRWKGRSFTLLGPPVDWKTEKTGLTLITRELI